jgi:hypothetical protein
MKFVAQWSARWLFLAAALIPLAAAAQTLTMTNGIQTYTALTNTTVTMTGRCELRVTATTNPIPGCIINLTNASPGAWLFFPNIRPSVVSAFYLSQVKVNGANAVAGSNCRLDQYAMGSVIIPQAPSYTPMTVFSGQNFLGTSAQFGLYTYYNTTAALGAMYRNISSFRLKRGYATTFAQNANGTGASKVYVAQDADLEVGIIQTSLDHACSFVRVFPWRWTGKKGWGGAADGTAALVNPLWSYDWNNGATSTLDTEYVPIRWGGGETWDPYSTDNSIQKSTHILGFNEPDSTAQANLSVATAIADWPNLMQSGLRVGAPAVSDSGVSGQGLDWLYSFMSQANALNYRVDYVPVHFYKCGWSASQLYNYLLGIYQQTGKPIWLTEFNYGASWCTPDTLTQAQEAAAIQQFVDTLDSAPFVERYAIYQWFPTNRAMVVNGALTPAGVMYHDKQSSIGYVQTVPPGGNRSIVQFQFETNTLDSSGFGNNGFAVGIPGYTAGHTGQAVTLDGTNSFIQLPPNVANSAAFTFAAWVYWNGGAQWQRIFDFGNDTSHYLFLTPSSSSGTLRFAINNGGGEQIIETTGMPSGQWRHVAVTLSGSNARLYTNGVLAASSSSFTNAPSNFNPNLNYLGKSQFPADPLFKGNLDEVQIADYAFTAAQIATLKTNLPPQFTTNFMTLTNASANQAYANSLAGTASDPNPGGALTYSKASGPAWLGVAANGTITGTPGADDAGTNNFTVRVTDTAGAGAFAILTIKVNGLLNPGFEAPATSTYIYNPSGGGWIFTAQSGANGSGVTANNSAFTSGNTNAPEGAQCAFLQGISTISQVVSGFIPGAKYNVTFAAAQRAYSSANGGQTWQVRIDGTIIGTFIPLANATNYVDYTTNFTATATTHTLRFVGTDLHGGDNTVFLDNVRLTFVSPPAAPAAPANLQAVAGDGQVALTWNAATFATSYNVKRSLTSGGGYVTNASAATTNHTDPAATNGTTYYYMVSAVNSGGEGPDSSQVSALPVSLSPPQLVSGVSGGQIQISWPADHLGWTLQEQTNDLSAGLGTNWISIPDSATNTQFAAPLAPETPSVFYRLIHQ